MRQRDLPELICFSLIVIIFMTSMNLKNLTYPIDDIMESVFCYQLQRHGGSHDAVIYYISVFDEKDPGDRLMNRLQSFKPSVRRISQKEKKGSLFNDKVRKRVLGQEYIFRIASFIRINQDRVEVRGSNPGLLSPDIANPYMVVMKRKGSHWTVERNMAVEVIKAAESGDLSRVRELLEKYQS